MKKNAEEMMDNAIQELQQFNDSDECLDGMVKEPTLKLTLKHYKVDGVSNTKLDVESCGGASYTAVMLKKYLNNTLDVKILLEWLDGIDNSDDDNVNK